MERSAQCTSPRTTKNRQGREFAVKVSKQKTSGELEIERDIYSALLAAGSPVGFVKVPPS